MTCRGRRPAGWLALTVRAEQVTASILGCWGDGSSSYRTGEGA
jgi:hypothetical protein